MNSAENQCAAALEILECRGNKLARRREDDGGVEWRRRIVVCSTNPFGSEFRGQLAMLLLACEDQHTNPEVLSYLNANMPGCTEAVDG